MVVLINCFYIVLIHSKYLYPETVLNPVLLMSPPHALLSGLSLNNLNEKFDSTQEGDISEFIRWFWGFSDAESNFSIVLYKNKTGTIISAQFRFTIELHIDDIDALNLIKSKLNIGNDIAVYGNSCKFTVTHPKDIYILIGIFDKYNLNTIKYLDYLDFKKAFIFYQERDKKINKEILIDQLLRIKNGMNSNRTNFNFPDEHKIIITDYWLLGFIEGEGSFYLSRNGFEPCFSIGQSEAQLPVLEKIKEHFESNLGFDKYSMFKLKSSASILITTGKAVNISKPLITLRIKNISVLINYLIPYIENMTFITKKSQDFRDFKIISTSVHKGSHRIEEIKLLILDLSYTMNNYRLSRNLDPKKLDSLSDKSINRIINAEPTIRHLDDGRQLDIVTGKAVNRRWTNCVYEIINDTGEIWLASTLNDAGEILGVNFRTVTRHLDSESLYLRGDYAEINGYKVIRVPVFNH